MIGYCIGILKSFFINQNLGKLTSGCLNGYNGITFVCEKPGLFLSLDDTVFLNRILDHLVTSQLHYFCLCNTKKAVLGIQHEDGERKFNFRLKFV